MVQHRCTSDKWKTFAPTFQSQGKFVASQHSNSAACLLACHLEVLVSSRNTKEPHDLPILCPASSRELHVSRALAHSHPNRKAHVHTNTTNVAEQQAALPRGVPGRRIKPAMRLENDFSLAPFIRQMSKPTRMTGTNRSLGIVCKHMFLFRLRPSLRGTMSLVRMISGSFLKIRNFFHIAF